MGKTKAAASGDGGPNTIYKVCNQLYAAAYSSIAWMHHLLTRTAGNVQVCLAGSTARRKHWRPNVCCAY